MNSEREDMSSLCDKWMLNILKGRFYRFQLSNCYVKGIHTGTYFFFPFRSLKRCFILLVMENERLKKLKREVHERPYLFKSFFLSIVRLIDEILENRATDNMYNL